MKKIAIVLFVVATALAGCGKKKAPAAPAGGDTAGSAAPAEAGSAEAGSAAPAEAGSGGM
jgi:hypothetical protein